MAALQRKVRTMFKTRLLSGIILVIIAVASVICGGYLLYGVTLAISLIGMYEFYRACDMERTLMAVPGYLAACVFYININVSFAPDAIMIPMIFLIVLMFVYVFSYPKYRIEQIAQAFFGFFYVAVMLSYVYQIRLLENGLYLPFLVFICSWGCDTCAYCVGMLIGKHKMSPVLSPKKSVEGAVGGVIGAALLSVIYCVILRDRMGIGMTEIAIIAGIVAVGALISMVGDLTASAIKRNHDIKDFGKLIPGHGGILDRFDSMMITAPIIFYLARIIL